MVRFIKRPNERSAVYNASSVCEGRTGSGAMEDRGLVNNSGMEGHQLALVGRYREGHDDYLVS